MNTGKKESNNKEQKSQIILNNKIPEEQRLQVIKNNLKCSKTNLNYINKPDIILGYPILRSKNDSSKKIDKIDLYPIPELISFDEFIKQMGDYNIMNYPNYDSSSFNTYYYNYWIPIYIDKKHYEKNKNTILYSFSLIKNGFQDIKEYNFKIDVFFEIFPIILNKIIEGILDENPGKSSSFIKCYFHYAVLFQKLTEEFEEEFVKYINHKFNVIHKNGYKFNKTILPNIPNFMTLLYFCKRDLRTEKLEKMWNCLFEEYLMRVIVNFFRDEENLKKLCQKYIEILVKKELGEKEFLKMLKKTNKECVEELKKIKIFNEVIDIISSDKDFLNNYRWTQNYAKLKIGEELKSNYKKIVNEIISKESQKKIYKLIHDNLTKIGYNISIDINSYEARKCLDELAEDIKDISIDEIMDYVYENEYENENVNIKAFIEFFELNAYKSPKENKILLISFLLQKIFKEKGFLEELEKNDCVIIDTDNISNEINKVLNKINNYKKFLEYIESEYGEERYNIEIILNSYEKANKIGLIKNEQKFDYKEIVGMWGISRLGMGRRGRGRGRGIRSG
jgi:hypothetical protein